MADLPTDIEVLLRARNLVDGELLRRLQVCDRSGEAARLGGGSTVGWLADAGRLDHRHASSLVRTARGLADRLPATAKALSTGDITLEHAQVLNRAVTPARVALAQTDYAGGMAQAEDDLLTVAILANPETTHRAAQSWAHTLDPQAEAMTQAQQHEARELYLDRTFDGMLSVNGRLDREAGDVLLTAIGALSTPRAAGLGALGGDTDLRTSPQRRADALTELCQQVLSAGDLPEVAGERPHLNLTVSLESLEQRAGAPAAQLGHTGLVVAETARRLACDASISRIITDGPARSSTSAGAPAPSAPRCAAPWSCATPGACIPAATGPPSWCEGHHLEHWVDGGTTDLANLILLCRRHHRAQHEGGRARQHRADQGKADRPGYLDTYRRRTLTATHCATCRPLKQHQPPRENRQSAPEPSPDDPF